MRHIVRVQGSTFVDFLLVNEPPFIIKARWIYYLFCLTSLCQISITQHNPCQSVKKEISTRENYRRFQV